MHKLLELEENSILLIPYNIKKRVLEIFNEQDTLLNIKIFTFDDLKRGLLFDYTNEAVYFIMQNENIVYDTAKTYLNYIYHINEMNYKEKKLNYLLNIKNELDKNNLLIKDNLFTSLLKSKSKLYVYGFNYINKFNTYLLDLAKDFINIEYIEKNNNDYVHKVFTFNKMEQEIIYVAEQIASLIEQNIDINKIYIANYTDDYYFTIKRIFKLYNIPYFIKENNTLYKTAIGFYFINHLNWNMDYLLNKIENIFDIKNNKNNEIAFLALQKLINNYYWYKNKSDIKDLIIEEMKHTSISSVHLDKEISLINILDNIINDDEYVFMIGFNSKVPKLKKDEDYIEDNIKPSTLEKSIEYNKNIKSNYIKSIKNIKNLIITNSETSFFEKFNPNILIDNINLIEEKKNINYSEYSHDLNKVLFASNIDKLLKFNEYNSSLDILNNNYSIDYKKYNNAYMIIDKDRLNKDLDDNLSLSYSNIVKYYECPFKFYIHSILGIKKYNEITLENFIGSLFHYVLENVLKEKDNSKIDFYYNEYIDNNIDKIGRSHKNLFFLNMLKEEIYFIIDTIEKQNKHSKHTKELFEHKIIIEKNNPINYKLTGVIDKILIYDNLCIIIDYKTGNSVKIDKDIIEFGLSIQLPIYMYLLKENMNLEVVGLYLQHILDLKDTYNKDDERFKNLKLIGLTLNDISKISIFDDTYDNSQVIHALKIIKDGTFSKNKNIITQEEYNEIYKTIESLLDNVIKEITNCNFPIYPIKIDNGKRYNGCDNCDYKDICFRKQKDFNNKDIKKAGDTNE